MYVIVYDIRSWNLYHLELESGVKYKLEVLSAGETLSVITFSAPGTSQLLYSFSSFDVTRKT